MDTSRYLDLFVQEAIEHLESLGTDLLAMERDGKPTALDAAFRHAHSIKGMAASMGFSPIAELAHGLEDLLDRHRKSASPITPSAIDAALAVGDALGALVRTAASKAPLESAGVDVTALIERLRSATPPDPSGQGGEQRTRAASSAPVPAVTLPATPPALDDAKESAIGPAARTRSHLKVSVRVSGTSKVPGVRGFLVHKRLSGMGEILSSEPTLGDLKAGRLPQGKLELVIATEVGEEAIARELATISELDEVEVETVAVTASPIAETWKAAPRAAGPQPSEPIRTVRVRTDLLDGFMDGVGELLLASDRLRQLARQEEPDTISPLTEAVERIGRIVKTLHRKVMATRMTPLSTVTDRLPRVVRETLRHSDKDAVLEVEGAEIELDRAILDDIESPLGHLIRNCIDHGIESPAERSAAGKPVRGRMRLLARRDRDRVIIDISDDGRGIDVAAVVKRAVEAGVLPERAAESLSRKDALMLACHPGLSTAKSVTEISGRGVGLDVVKETVESLGGFLEMESEPGQGTLFTLALPLTIAIQRLLLVSVGEDLFAVPVNKVLHVMHVERERRTTTRGQPMVPFRENLVRSLHLPDLLRMSHTRAPADPLPHVVVEGASGKPVALTVDGLAGHIEGVVRPLGRPLDLLGGLSGVSLLPDGRPVLVLDLASLVRTTESVDLGARRIA